MTRVLLIDDSVFDTSIIQDALESKSIHHKVVNNSMLGLAAAESYQPDVIILDLHTSHTNGIDLLTKIRASSKTKDIEVIFLSASKGTNGVLDDVHLRIADFIPKGVAIDTLLTKINQLSTTKKIRDEFHTFEAKMQQMYDKYERKQSLRVRTPRSNPPAIPHIYMEP